MSKINRTGSNPILSSAVEYHNFVYLAGITADLEAMKENGIGGAYLMPIKGPTNPPLLEPPVVQLSPLFWSMVKFAVQEADRLGLQMGMHFSDGFALAGLTVTPSTLGYELLSLKLSEIAPILPYMLMVLILIFRPKGLMGTRED